VPLDTWRVVLASPGGELPFFLDLSRQDGRLVATLINGTEHVPTTDVSLDDSRLAVDFAAFSQRSRQRPNSWDPVPETAIGNS
jgi:hypothetical protein